MDAMEKIVYQNKNVVLDPRLDPGKYGVYARVVVSNSSIAIADRLGLFLRVNSRTRRLQICPNGVSSVGLRVDGDLLAFWGDVVWSVCEVDGEEEYGSIYAGNLESNEKKCGTKGGTEINIKVVGIDQ